MDYIALHCNALGCIGLHPISFFYIPLVIIIVRSTAFILHCSELPQGRCRLGGWNVSRGKNQLSLHPEDQGEAGRIQLVSFSRPLPCPLSPCPSPRPSPPSLPCPPHSPRPPPCPSPTTHFIQMIRRISGGFHTFEWQQTVASEEKSNSR